jgi:predicted nucleic acid-binding Zn ribbon protein
MRGRSSPRPLGAALRGVRRRSEPKTLLAAVQGVWAEAVGPAVAAQAAPIRERERVVTVACKSATWAEELDLLQIELLGGLNERLGDGDEQRDRPRVAQLRFTAQAPDHF